MKIIRGELFSSSERIRYVLFVFSFRFQDHPVLNDRYLLLSLIGKGGFSEVHKVKIFRMKKTKLTEFIVFSRSSRPFV